MNLRHWEVITRVHLLQTQAHPQVLLKVDTINQVPFPPVLTQHLEVAMEGHEDTRTALGLIQNKDIEKIL